MSARKHAHAPWPPPKKKFGKNLHSAATATLSSSTVSASASATVGRSLPPPPISSFHYAVSSSNSNNHVLSHSLSSGGIKSKQHPLQQQQQVVQLTKRETHIQSSTSGGGGLLLLSTKKGNYSVGDSSKRHSLSGLSGASSKTTAIVKGTSTHDALVNALNGDRQERVKEKVPSAWGFQAASVPATATATSSSSMSGSGGGSRSASHHGDTAKDGHEESATTTEKSGSSVIPSTAVLENTCAADDPEINHDHSWNNREHDPVQYTPKNMYEDQEEEEFRHDHEEKSQEEKEHNSSRKNNNDVMQESITNQLGTRHDDDCEDARITPPEATVQVPTDTEDMVDNCATDNHNECHDNDHDHDQDHPIVSKEESNNITTTEPIRKESLAENQEEFMKKLAKERAEKRRLEELERETLQKERAMQRLHELEMKLEKERRQKQQLQEQQVTRQPSGEDWVKLRHEGHHHSDGGQRAVPMRRQLYDPNKSYSSLLGGSQGVVAKNDAAVASATMMAGAAVPDLAPPSVDMIHFSSYEDQNRNGGSRNAEAGPRMLFDPKSGSMIAAPSVSKEKKLSKKSHPRKNSKDALDDTSLHSRNILHQEDGVYDGNGKSLRQNSKSRQGPSKRNMKQQIEVKPAPKSEFSYLKSLRTLPRTCGVLYKRDESGNIVSADGCEGDQGYGAHSVPGGRIRNPKAYAAKKQKERESGKHQPKGQPKAPHHYSGMNLSNVEQKFSQGLNRSHFMRKNPHPQTSSTLGAVPSSPVEALKGDDKLDLLSNLDASPKLQATAAAWAPSQAVLALTASKTKQINREDLRLFHENDDLDSSDDMSESGVHIMNTIALVDTDSVHGVVDPGVPSPSIDLGLGFDPSKNMDSLMMSPAMGAETPNDIDLTDLELKESPSKPRSTTNPFMASNSILGSSTWGASGNNSRTMGSLSNWDLLSNKTLSPNGSMHKNDGPKTFLSLGVGGDQTTWSNHGTPFGGFNSIDAPSMGSSD